MLKVKLVSWAAFLLWLSYAGSKLRTTEDLGNDWFVLIAILLSIIQLDMLGRYSKKQKTNRLIKSTGPLDHPSMPRTSPTPKQ